MARIRSIKPEFPQSESMGRVSRAARLLFVLLWTICDDSGRTRAASRMLASLLFPYDDDAADLIDGWLDELEQEGCIVRYSEDGSTYLQICKWSKHQKIDKPSPSRLPAPREDSRGFAKPRECSSEDLGSRIVGSRNGAAAASPPCRAAQPPEPPLHPDDEPAPSAPRRPAPAPIPTEDFIAWKRSRRIYVARSDEAGSMLDWRDLHRQAGEKILTEAYDAMIPGVPADRGLGFAAIRRWIFERYQEAKP